MAYVYYALNNFNILSIREAIQYANKLRIIGNSERLAIDIIYNNKPNTYVLKFPTNTYYKILIALETTPTEDTVRSILSDDPSSFPCLYYIISRLHKNLLYIVDRINILL